MKKNHSLLPKTFGLYKDVTQLTARQIMGLVIIFHLKPWQINKLLDM